MDSLTIALGISIVVALVLGFGYIIFHNRDQEIVHGGKSARQKRANEHLQELLGVLGHRSIHRRAGRYVYDDGSFIEDLLLLDILMDGELDFNFIPEYTDGEYDSEANAAIFAEVDTILPEEQTFQKEADGLEYRSAPEVSVESASEPEKSYSDYSTSDSGGGSDD